ncbi:MAG: integrase core domain-containing protein, partial [Pseudomonadota bacterium]
LPARHKRRQKLYHKDGSIVRLRPQHPNHIWSVDFVHDKLSNGSTYRTLTGIDEYTREALAVVEKPRMGSKDDLEALYPLILERGKPTFIRSDNGKEFTTEVLQTWLKKVGIQPIQIYPGSPWENGYNERFNGTLRREVLNAEWFATVDQAKTVIGKWLRQNNHIRPHQALGMRPLVPETLAESALAHRRRSPTVRRQGTIEKCLVKMTIGPPSSINLDHVPTEYPVSAISPS